MEFNPGYLFKSFLLYLLLSWLSNTTIGLKQFWSCILIFTPLWFHKIFMQHLITLCASRVLKYQKSLISIGQRLSWLLDERIAKMSKRFFSQRRFVIILIICFEMHMDRPDRSISLLFLILSILIIIHFCCYMSWLISH